jgi:hypothetical protein
LKSGRNYDVSESFISRSHQKINPNTIQAPTPAPMQIPATFSTATLSPCLAAWVNLEALPLRFVEREEKTSLCDSEISILSR